MNSEKPLFTGENIYFAPIDREKDAEVASTWTHDPAYLHGIGASPALPRSAAKIKKQYETLEKSMDEGKRFYFTVRTKDNDRLIGFGEIFRIGWTNQSGTLALGIGSADDRRRGFGAEILRLLVRYAFDELSFYRLSAQISADNTAALALFQKAGFVEEVRQRNGIHRDGQRWDLIHLGLLQEERQQ